MKHLLPLVATLCSFTSLAAQEVPADAPFRDPSQPLEVRIADLMERLTLEEKAILLNHRGPTLERFGIRSDQWNQCLNGVQWNRPTTLFPTCIAMAATWDPDFLRSEIAKVLSDEARAIYNGWRTDPEMRGEHKGLIYRDPVINIGRNPYWGRNHEAFGEDPYLTGRMGVAYVKGIQGDDPRYLKLASTLKHYAVNNVETERFELDAKVSERMLHEYWLPHFRDAVEEGEAQSLMASYNAINGVPNNINKWLLTEVLKEDWGHKGFVVSDLGGVRTMVEGHEGGQMSYVDAVAQSLMAGCDFSDREFQEHIPAAVREGKLSEERLNDALTRVLRTRFRLGEFDPFESVPYSRISPEIIGSDEHRAVALEAARKSIVLLQNRGDLLPLDKSSLKKVAVLGPLADQVVLNNYNGRHEGLVTALQGLRNRLGDEIEVVHAKGAELVSLDDGMATQVDRESGFSGGRSRKLTAGGPGEFIEFTVELPEAGRFPCRLQYKAFPGRGIYELSIDGDIQGERFDMHAAAERYAARFDFGEKEFTAGKHTLRFTVVGKHADSEGFTGHFDRLDLGNGHQFELEQTPFTLGRDKAAPSGIDKAVELARSADVAIVCVGTDHRVEQEGRDRRTLGLTGNQEELVLAVSAANPKTIVVQMSAGPLTVPTLKDKVPAMLQAWWCGEEGGNALADVLLGTVNPAGRLPHTVYASESQVPSRDEYDISQGYTYMYLKGEPLYAFGHGLSYTTFDYDKLKVTPESVSADGSVTVSVEVSNSGSRDGDDVVQVYLREVDPAVKRPAKELRGFQRISLKSGETKTVSITIPVKKFAYWSEEDHAFVVKPGSFEIIVGASATDIRERAMVTVQ